MPTLDNEFAIVAALCPDGPLGEMGEQSENCSDVEQSEVNSLIFWHPTIGVPPTNWGLGIAATDFDIDNSDNTDVKLKQIFAKGSVPATETVTTTVNSFREITISRTSTLSLTLYSFDASTYDYLRKLQYGTVMPLFAYTSVAQKLFGKDGGIVPSKFEIDFIQDEGEESLEHFLFTIQWKSKTAPDRLINPLP